MALRRFPQGRLPSLPERNQSIFEIWVLILWLSSWSLSVEITLWSQSSVEQTDRVLAIVTTDTTELIQHDAFRRL